jgi:hypothetical protein
MNDDIDIKVRRLMQQLEHQFVEINKRNINEIAGEITEQDFMKLADAISICRANYLKEVLQMANNEDGTLSARLSQQVRDQRLLYEEAMQGFDALRHALGRGYFHLGGN